MQCYFTLLIGDANDRPILIGTEDFEGIALIDTNLYIEDGNGARTYGYSL
jgi:hypothetical protein